MVGSICMTMHEGDTVKRGDEVRSSHLSPRTQAHPNPYLHRRDSSRLEARRSSSYFPPRRSCSTRTSCSTRRTRSRRSSGWGPALGARPDQQGGECADCTRGEGWTFVFLDMICGHLQTPSLPELQLVAVCRTLPRSGDELEMDTVVEAMWEKRKRYTDNCAPA